MYVYERSRLVEEFCEMYPITDEQFDDYGNICKVTNSIGNGYDTNMMKAVGSVVRKILMVA